MPLFQRYFGIDYSGAETPDRSLPGLRLFAGAPGSEPAEVAPPPSPRKYWTRRGLAEWLAAELRDGPPTLVGIDHAFSFPMRYFEIHHLPPDWPAFLDDFQRHWPTDRSHTYVDFVRRGRVGRGAERAGVARWRRLTEELVGAKSPFHFDVPGSVATSTHAGLPWLRYLRQQLGDRLHFWPFDGWAPPPGRSTIAEIYPSMWKNRYPRGKRTSDQHDAYSAARWMGEADADGSLPGFFKPDLTVSLRGLGRVEGWILGLGGENVREHLLRTANLPE